jgi:hypothetical protein
MCKNDILFQNCPQGQCKPHAESSLFAVAKPVLAVLFQKALQRYYFLRTQPNKMHKNSRNVHTSAVLCNDYYSAVEK